MSLREEIKKLIKKKIEEGKLKKYIKTIEKGKPVLKEITDPEEYLNALLEKKRMIKGDFYSDEYLLESIKREDLGISEQEKQMTEIAELKVSDLDNDISNFSIKIKVDIFETREVTLKRGGEKKVMRILGHDDTGECEVTNIWESENTRMVFEYADNGQLKGKTIEITNGYTQNTKYSMFPFVIKPHSSSLVKVINENISDLKISETFEQLNKVVHIKGKIYKVFNLREYNYSRGDENVVLKSREFILLDKEGNTIIIRLRKNATNYVPREGTFVSIIFGHVIKDKWKEKKGYNPEVIDVTILGQIKEINENTGYPDTPKQKIRSIDLFEADLSGTIETLISIHDIKREKWDERESTMIPVPPYYLSCGVDGCRKKVIEMDGQYICTNGHQPTKDTVKKRFLCNAIITDYVTEMKVLISEDTIEKITGRKAEDLIKDADEMDLEMFYNNLNDFVNISGNLFKVKGRLKIDQYGESFIISDIERVDYYDEYEKQIRNLKAELAN